MFSFWRKNQKQKIGDPLEKRGEARDFWAHRSRIERTERRLALSAVPWLPVDLVQHEIDAGLSTDNIVGPTLANQNIAPPVETMLAEAHQQTGWNVVNNQFGLNGTGQTVAVIDSGIAFDHVALGGGYGSNYRVVGGWDFAENDNRPYDDAPAGFHGTHVAGIIGANDGVHFGVAPNVDLVALRVFNDTGRGEMAWTEAALKWVHENRNAFENPITTVNLSLGSNWNSSTVPSWGILEDELAQLYQDGIVVIASAGNSFQQYKAPGVAYPAASPYVIPVASVDANNQLSDFSQRDSRVIAAPGRSIESTVPDYFYGKDGNPNDFANASGTSMAAPYVAGASVLIREAMELAGVSVINSQSIYNVLKSSANWVFDSITNQSYSVLNLDAAIESILPKDNVGDSFATATSLQLQSNWTTDSWINTLQDLDYYKLMPAENGTVSLKFSSDVLEHEVIGLIRNGSESLLTEHNGVYQFDIKAGDSIGIKIDDLNAIGKYHLEWSFAPAQVTEPVPSFATLQGDTLSIRGNAEANAFLVDLSNGIRVDVDGESYHWDRTNIKNVLIDGLLNNDTLKIIGSSESEKIELQPGLTTLENDWLKLKAVQIENVQFVGGGGPDRAYLYDAETNDRLNIWPNKAELTGVGYSFSVEQVSRIFVHANQGGDDQAFVYDSAGDDTLSVRPQFTSLNGSGYFNYVSGFERVYAYANSGGIDKAQLYDSAGNDLFSTSGEVTSIVGVGFSTFARGFENVEAFSTAGGIDRALIYATASGRLTGGSDYVGMEDSVRTSIARGFERVETFANGVPTPVTQAALNSFSVVDQPADYSRLESSLISSNAQTSDLGSGQAAMQTDVTGGVEQVLAPVNSLLESVKAGSTDDATAPHPVLDAQREIHFVSLSLPSGMDSPSASDPTTSHRFAPGDLSLQTLFEVNPLFQREAEESVRLELSGALQQGKLDLLLDELDSAIEELQNATAGPNRKTLDFVFADFV